MTNKNRNRPITRKVALELGFKDDRFFMSFGPWMLSWTDIGQVYILSRVGGQSSEVIEIVGDLLNYIEAEPITTYALDRLGWESDQDGEIQRFTHERFEDLLHVDFERTMVYVVWEGEEGKATGRHAGAVIGIETLGQLYEQLEDSRILPYQTELEKKLTFT